CSASLCNARGPALFLEGNHTCSARRARSPGFRAGVDVGNWGAAEGGASGSPGGASRHERFARLLASTLRGDPANPPWADANLWRPGKIPGAALCCSGSRLGAGSKSLASCGALSSCPGGGWRDGWLLRARRRGDQAASSDDRGSDYPDAVRALLASRQRPLTFPLWESPPSEASEEGDPLWRMPLLTVATMMVTLMM